jgi:hypothetical protein
MVRLSAFKRFAKMRLCNRCLHGQA